MKASTVVVSLGIVALLMTGGIVGFIAMNPQVEQNVDEWKAVYQDGYTIGGLHDTAIIGDPTFDMSVYDMKIRHYNNDTNFVTVDYCGERFTGIFDGTYLEIKGSAENAISIMYGAVLDDNTLYVVYVDSDNDSNLDSSVYVCYYTKDGSIPSIKVDMDLDITGWRCQSSWELSSDTDDHALKGSSISVTTWADTGLFRGYYEGTKADMSGQELPTCYVDYIGVVIPKAVRSVIGCDVILLDEECDIWQAFVTSTQLTMFCTWADSKSVYADYRLYAESSEYKLPKGYDIKGTWKALTSYVFNADGKLEVLEDSVSFELGSGSGSPAINAMYTGTTSAGGKIAVYITYNGDEPIINFKVSDKSKDNFNYCTATMLPSGHMLLFQSYFVDGKMHSAYTVFEKQVKP